LVLSPYTFAYYVEAASVRVNVGSMQFNSVEIMSDISKLIRKSGKINAKISKLIRTPKDQRNHN
jgi:hypothetical protein